MKKRGFALLLTCALVLVGAVGCGGGGTTGGDQGAAPEGETIKIGAMGPLTGDLSIYGTAVDNGIKLAVEEINAAGGILGKQVECTFLDEKGDSTEAVNAYNRLVQNEKVVAIIGDVTSTPSIAVAQASVQDGSNPPLPLSRLIRTYFLFLRFF